MSTGDAGVKGPTPGERTATEASVLDPQLLDTVEKNATKLAMQLDHIMASLRAPMHEICELSADGMAAYRMAGDDLSDAVAQSVANAHMFLRKTKQLHEQLSTVEKYYDSVKDIKKTLDMLELQVSRNTQR